MLKWDLVQHRITVSPYEINNMAEALKKVRSGIGNNVTSSSTILGYLSGALGAVSVFLFRFPKASVATAVAGIVADIFSKNVSEKEYIMAHMQHGINGLKKVYNNTKITFDKVEVTFPYWKVTETRTGATKLYFVCSEGRVHAGYKDGRRIPLD